MTRRHPRLPLLDRITAPGHRVIEASAGTGKTYTLERVVVDLVLRRGCRIEEILVVTFTEKAARELRQRVRALLADVLENSDHGEYESAWEIGPGETERLQAALRDFDAAPIHTIHGFCQRVLQEFAFAGGRLLESKQVDARSAFGSAFRAALRSRLATRHAALLEGVLGDRTPSALEEQLFELHELHASPLCPFDGSRILGAARRAASAASSLDTLPIYLRSVYGRKEKQRATAEGWLAVGADPDTTSDDVLDALRRLQNASWAETLGQYTPRDEEGELHAALTELADVLPTYKEASFEILLDAVREELERRKAARGEFDFDDMLTEVARGLEGADGDAMRRELRARHRFALIDEFQDTDPVQWRIFERLFVEDDPGGEDGALYIVGDPKQAIYGFRGADVDTYLRARRRLAPTKDDLIDLDVNWRGTPDIVDAMNMLFDSNTLSPFFSGAIRLAGPLGAGRTSTLVAPEADEAPKPVHVVDFAAGETARSPAALRDLWGLWIADEITRLTDGELAVREGSTVRPIRRRDVFVLVRSNTDADEVARHLTAASIPYTFPERDGALTTDEARDVRDVLAAVAAPGEAGLRLKALVTPFFAVPPAELPLYRDLPDTHPFMQRLLRWRRVAQEEGLVPLADALMDDSGVTRRELFFSTSRRRLVNYRHVLDALIDSAAGFDRNLEQALARLDAFLDGRRLPEEPDAAMERHEGVEDAVQVMTIHKSKGLEAAVVFVYGGLRSGGSSGPLAVIHDGEGARRSAESKHRPDVKREVQRMQREEDERLMYVAATRAAARLYLPRVGSGPDGTPELEVTGAYGPMHDRLVALEQEDSSAWRRLVHRITATPVDGTPSPAVAESWWPDPRSLRPPSASGDYERFRRQRAGVVMESYSSMKARAEERADDDLSRGDAALADGAAPPELPGGRRSGLFLHEVLEHVDLGVVAEAPDRATWVARPEVRELLESAAARYDRSDGVELAAELVWTTLTRELEFGGTRARLCDVGSPVREPEFTFPYPGEGLPTLDEGWSERIRIGRGYVRGYIDLVFMLDGRTWVLDWKSDLLARWDPTSVATHVTENYGLQASLYTHAVLKATGIHDARAYEERFGGVAYCFLRAMDTPGGLWTARPTWEEALAFESALAEEGARA